MAKKTVITDKILKYLEEHVGSIVYRDDIVAAFDIDPVSVRNAIYTLRNTRPGFDKMIEVIVAGRTWRIHALPAAEPVKEKSNKRPGSIPGGTMIIELVKELKSGSSLVEDEDGNLYKLTPVE